MTFNSVEFAIFLIALFFAWSVFPLRNRWLPLLAGSYGFYMFWKVEYVFALLFCTLLTYFSAKWLCKAKDYQKKIIFILCISGNIGLLFFFKYTNFATESINRILPYTGAQFSIPYADLIFPIGISFYALQSVSYITDVYRKEIQPENHFGYFALYLAFFPKLISGPIERAACLLPQLKKDSVFNISGIYSGLSLFIWGLFKKVVIADRLAIYVNMVFDSPHDYWGKTLILASYLFTIQIYCDFSGYTDMAIGCGRIFGIELTKNFKFPYFSRSISDFWRRWHISLTSWLKDYLYVPLGGNRVRHLRWQANIMTVFLISGLWHGANWTFIVWGVLHGIYLLIGKQTQRYCEVFYKRIGLNGMLLKMWQVFFTFNLVSISWIFFRADTIADAIYIITHFFYRISWPLKMGASEFTTVLTVFLLMLFLMLETICFFDMKSEFRKLTALPPYIKYTGYIAAVILISLCGVSHSQFIYFHF